MTDKADYLEELKAPRYINPYTDFGFKKLFGSPLNKELLISFLNSLFNGREKINDLKYLNGENLGSGYGDRRAIFDVYCKNDKDEFFIVEMQKAEQQYFKDRSIFYASFPIQNQGVKGQWDFRLKAVYTVGILDFVFPDHEYSDDCLHHEVKLMDVDDKHVFYDKLTFVYLEMPKFNKREDQLETMFDKWLFVLRNLSNLMQRPKALQERVFVRLFRQAEIAKYTPEERMDYEESLKIYRDLKNVVDTAELKGVRKGLEKGLARGMAKGMAKGREEGLAKGREEGLVKGREQGLTEAQREIARKMKSAGISAELIHKTTGLSIEDIALLS